MEREIEVIFDMNGTMADDTEFNNRAWHRFCGSNKCIISEDEILPPCEH